MLVSRVRTLDSLRLLQDDVAGRQALSRLKHDEYLAAWERGTPSPRALPMRAHSPSFKNAPLRPSTGLPTYSLGMPKGGGT